jgi:hypothetical protein
MQISMEAGRDQVRMVTGAAAAAAVGHHRLLQLLQKVQHTWLGRESRGLPG